jgi:DNA-binding LacI/PurR family transcriptional regulator
MDALAAKWAAFKGALAVVCYDDLFAVRFMTSMHKLGLSAPKDFRVVAWNDSPLAAFSDPPLTSLRPDYAYSGMKIVKCALAASEGKEWKSDVITPNTLVIRESCGGLKRLTPRLAGKIKELFFDIETPTLKQAGTEAVPA